MKKLTSLFVIGLSITFIVWLYQWYAGAIRYSLNPREENRVVVEIKKGSSIDTIAETLYQKKLIASPMIFKLYLKQNELAHQVKAGRIVLKSNQTLPEIVQALVEGKTEELAVTVLEGWTANQIGEQLEKIGVTTQKDFMECVKTCVFVFDFLPKNGLEGYLYPDTYFIDSEGFDSKTFIRRMLSTFKNHIDSADEAVIQKSARTLEEIVIVASIVEREERNSSERPRVAGILWKRLDNNIGLGVDATILYALGRTKGGLTAHDLAIQSPYNTRKYRGLPPTPISNPGVESLEAAIYPQKSDYLYYLHDSEGGIHYGKTLKEHNANKAKYL
ncbi:endolytic transglycosylase MltG [Candidatus Peregrinibacteria bacterium CG_4_10_14_0_2_um_filter_43_11]|nr:MAG: endolytic transglycosylase MltG [Candidatus Peregrinibacteria bacterium CG_4_10_14_0_2_um_filter_43_11]